MYCTFEATMITLKSLIIVLIERNNGTVWKKHENLRIVLVGIIVQHVEV